MTKDRSPNPSRGLHDDNLHGLLQYIRVRPNHLATALKTSQTRAAQDALGIMKMGQKWAWGLQRASAVAIFMITMDQNYETKQHQLHGYDPALSITRWTPTIHKLVDN